MLQWFGVRGIGSLYWLAFALNRRVPAADAGVVTAATLGLIAVSVVVHGVSATPVAPPTAATRVKAAARRMLEWRMQRKPSDLNGRR